MRRNAGILCLKSTDAGISTIIKLPDEWPGEEEGAANDSSLEQFAESTRSVRALEQQTSMYLIRSPADTSNFKLVYSP